MQDPFIEAPSLEQPKPGVPPIAVVYLAIMIASWAGNWPLMKLAVTQVPPVLFVLFRLLGSFLLVTPGLLAARQPLVPVQGERWGLFWSGSSKLPAS